MTMKYYAILMVLVMSGGCLSTRVHHDDDIALLQIGDRLELISNALNAYKAEYSAYPESLGDLVPEFLPDKEVLWLEQMPSSHFRSYLVYSSKGFSYGRSVILGFTSGEVPGGGRLVIVTYPEASVWHWGEGAFQEWLSGDEWF